MSSMKKFIDGSIGMTKVKTPFQANYQFVAVPIPESHRAEFAMALAKFRDAYLEHGYGDWLCFFAEGTPIHDILYDVFAGNGMQPPLGVARVKYREDFLDHWIYLCIGGEKTPEELCIEQGISVESISWEHC